LIFLFSGDLHEGFAKFVACQKSAKRGSNVELQGERQNETHTKGNKVFLSPDPSRSPNQSAIKPEIDFSQEFAVRFSEQGDSRSSGSTHLRMRKFQVHRVSTNIFQFLAYLGLNLIRTIVLAYAVLNKSRVKSRTGYIREPLWRISAEFEEHNREFFPVKIISQAAIKLTRGSLNAAAAISSATIIVIPT
jgi:hypothetical protein